jgi:hypothetical protein
MKAIYSSRVSHVVLNQSDASIQCRIFLLSSYVKSGATPADDLNTSATHSAALKLATLAQLIKLCTSFNYSDGAAR